MKKFKFGKLVRDKIADNITAEGGKVDLRVLSDVELLLEAKKKLLEESQELQNAKDEDLLSELADTQEILELILSLKGVSKEELALIRAKKVEKVGGYEKKLFIESAQIPEDSDWINHFLSQPDKYEEVKK